VELTALSNSYTRCPDCQAVIKKDDGYIVWCDQCNWNLQPSEEKEPKNLFEKLYRQVGERVSDDLLSKMIQKRDLRAKMSARKGLVLFFSSIVHMFSLALLICGIYLIATKYTNVFFLFLSAICLLAAWLTKPTRYKPPSKPLSRTHFPVTYQIIDEICSATHAKKIHGVVVTTEFNASYALLGIWRKRIIELGFPLITILEKQEVVSLLAHELAHGMNNDLQRGAFVGSAINALSVWHRLIKPDKIFTSSENLIIAICMIPANLLLLLTAKLISLWLQIICHLNWQSSQQAEYMADRKAADIAGKTSMTSLLNKLLLDSLFDFCVMKTFNNPGRITLTEEFRNRAAGMPNKEWERLKRVTQLTKSRLDVTHPPTANRLAHIDSLDFTIPKYQLSEDMYKQLMREIFTLKSEAEKKIIDEHKGHIFR